MVDDNYQGIDLTEKQLDRQLNKIRKLVFEDYETYEDGSYKGEITQDILTILKKHMPEQDEVSDIIFLGMVKDAALDVAEYILSSLKGIDKRLASLYSYDFSNQSYNSIYSVGLRVKEDDNNPMYG
jgi:hypothetical protein